MDTLKESLQEEIERVKEIIKNYENSSIIPENLPVSINVINLTFLIAERAIEQDDPVLMEKCCGFLKEVK